MPDDRSRDDKLRDYAEFTGALDELEASHGWQVLVDRLRRDSGFRRGDILSGNLDQERYRFECGWLAGALYATGVPDQVRKEYQTLLDMKGDSEPDQEEA